MAGSLSAASSPASGDYKALVCVFLSGGSDSFNMLAPVDTAGYGQYLAAREGIALPAEDLVSLNTTLPDGRELGLQKEMAELHGLFDDGRAAFVANVGTLVEPTSISGINSGTAKLPLGLYSHSDQRLHWQSGLPDDRASLSGWGGRMADLIDDLNGISNVSMNVSLSGINLFQSGAETSVLARSASAVSELVNWNSGSFLPRRAAMETMLDAEYNNALERAFAGIKKNSISAAGEFKAALGGQPPLATGFDSSNDLSMQLKAVAETIAARGPLCKRRQTFFVEMGGWDHHSSLESHPNMLGNLSQAVGEFQQAMVELDLEDEVTLFSASDFGRTLSSNGGGSDHAWGGNQFVVGGAVQGGQVFGTYPELALASSLDTGRGRLIPTTAVDEYFADLALWMGVSPSDLSLVLPNLSRFHDVVSGGAPLGMMGS